MSLYGNIHKVICYWSKTSRQGGGGDGFVSLEGFVAATCLVEALKQAVPDLDTEEVIDALESIRDFDPGIGPIISFGPSRHQASHEVWGTILDAKAQFQVLDLQ